MIYNSMKALANAEPAATMAILRMAKGLNAPGFNINGTINYKLLEPWLKERKEELEDGSSDSLQYYKKEIAKKDVVLRDLEIQKRKGNYLEPEDVKAFLNKVALSQNALFISRMKELPVKLEGKKAADIDTALKEVTHEICSIFSKELSQWKP